jgi:hypothetical protein
MGALLCIAEMFHFSRSLDLAIGLRLWAMNTLVSSYILASTSSDTPRSESVRYLRFGHV